MPIIITDDPEVHVTQDELAKWRERYNQAFGGFAGKPPTLAQYIARERGRSMRDRIVSVSNG